MDMKVKSELICEQRNKRGWTQEHLARVAGLGLRTIHRIENEGVASAESIMAIASALSIDIESLKSCETKLDSNNAKNHHGLELTVRLGLAMASGLFVSMLLYWKVYRSVFTPSSLSETVVLFICGSLFGIFVLYPHLAKDKMFSLRAIFLVLSSGVSFSASVILLFYSVDNIFGENAKSFMLASLVGSLIVLLSVRIIIPMKVSKIFWFLTVVTSLFSGAYMYLATLVLSDYQLNSLASIIGFCLWHSLLALILFHCSTKNDPGRSSQTILTPLIRKLANLSVLQKGFFSTIIQRKRMLYVTKQADNQHITRQITIATKNGSGPQQALLVPARV